mmetsp:Transcript_11222/g.16859  ORF Transcript_11222/g.16859 Transcript_11222/m.16859 type:complete len:178 (+) Transcript_11222:104-637(+)
MGCTKSKLVGPEVIENYPSFIRHEMHLTGPLLGPEATVKLAEVILKLPQLISVDLSKNSLKDMGGPDNVAAVIEALTHCEVLNTLKINNCQLGDDGAKAVAKHLPKLTVNRLELQGNGIQKEGMLALFEALAQSKARLVFLEDNLKCKEGSDEWMAVMHAENEASNARQRNLQVFMR